MRLILTDDEKIWLYDMLCGMGKFQQKDHVRAKHVKLAGKVKVAGEPKLTRKEVEFLRNVLTTIHDMAATKLENTTEPSLLERVFLKEARVLKKSRAAWGRVSKGSSLLLSKIDVEERINGKEKGAPASKANKR